MQPQGSLSRAISNYDCFNDIDLKNIVAHIFNLDHEARLNEAFSEVADAALKMERL
jgi:hypothetical protein